MSQTIRREEVRDFKRQRILDAAREVFMEQGLEAATMRAIAAGAGYVPGALYSYFPSKEAIYGEMLNESLGALGRRVQAAGRGEPEPRARARARFRTFHAFYADRPEELNLGLCLFSAAGARRAGLTPEIDRQLNGRLIRTLGVMSESLIDYAGIEAADANRETVSTVCQLIGALILQATGRLDLLGFEEQELVDRHIDEMLDRLSPA